MRKSRIIVVSLLFVLIAAACQPAQTPTPAALPPTRQLASPTLPPAVSPAATAAATPQGTWIQLASSAASPGEEVAIDGYLPGGPTASTAQSDASLQYANVCWQGCLSGIVLQGQSVTWSDQQPGSFQIKFNVPAIAWIQDTGTQAMTTGDYLVGIQCLGADQKGCALNEAQASAKLHVEVPGNSVQSKTTPELAFNPTSAHPGEQVKVTGWAPLDEVVGGMAFGYSLVLVSNQGGQNVPLGDIQQNLDGTFSGSFVVPQSVPGTGPLNPGQYTLALQAARPQTAKATSPLLLAQTSFNITAGLAWQDLRLGVPDWLQFSGTVTGPDLFTTPSFPGWLAYCDKNGGLRTTRDNGKTWTSVPTHTVSSAAPDYTFDVASGNVPCFSVVMDPGKPGSYYATFQAARKDAGAPPVYFMGFFTTDSGATWNAVPLPQGASQEMFGGFWAAGKQVEAFFWGESGNQDQPAPAIVEATSDGGATWQPASPACPTGQSGSCLRWGPTASSISGMGSPAPQFVIRSPDDGKSWSYPGPSVELRMQGPHQLVTFPGNPLKALLIAGTNDFPVQFSQDGGQTWNAITLPAMPGADDPGEFANLQALPDGNLVAMVGSNQWMLLSQGSGQWCPAAGLDQAQQTSQFASSGNLLWWISFPNGDPTIGNIPLGTVRCK